MNEHKPSAEEILQNERHGYDDAIIAKMVEDFAFRWGPKPKYEFVEFVSSLAAILYVVNTKASRQ